MDNQLQKQQPQSAITKFQGLLSQSDIKKRFDDALGKKAPMFMSNLVTMMSTNSELQKCEPSSIISSALMSASMDLPITPGLGFSAIIPYWDNKSKTMKAQYQVMKRGYIQLAQRTGLFETIHVTEVYEGELVSHDRFTGEMKFDQTKKTSDKVIGYVSYFKLINGFCKYFYMSEKEVEKHARKYSKSFQKGFGKWADKEDGFTQMALKTVLKLNLSSWAPLSVDTNLQKAVIYDQTEIKDLDGNDYEYFDNENTEQPSQKEVIDIGGAEVVIDSKNKERSEKITNGVAETIKKHTEDSLSKLGLKELHDIIAASDKMKLAVKTTGVNKVGKYREIILAYQAGTIDNWIDEELKKSSKEIDKEGIDIPDLGEDGKRTFGDSKELFESLSDMGINTTKFNKLKESNKFLEKYANKNAFCKSAGVDEVKQLIGLI